MTAPLQLERYINRKAHDCGCVTVWDTQGGRSRYAKACCTHRGHALRFQAQ